MLPMHAVFLNVLLVCSTLSSLPEARSQCTSGEEDSPSDCSDADLNVNASLLLPMRRFQIDAPSPLIEVALFNTSYDLCDPALVNFSDGYRCNVLEPRRACDEDTCIHTVACGDVDSPVTLEDGPVQLVASMEGESEGEDESESQSTPCYLDALMQWSRVEPEKNISNATSLPPPFIEEITAVGNLSTCVISVTGCLPPCCGDNSTDFEIAFFVEGLLPVDLKFFDSEGACNSTLVTILNGRYKWSEDYLLFPDSRYRVVLTTLSLNATYGLGYTGFGSTYGLEGLSNCLDTCIVEEFHCAIEDECSGITDVHTTSLNNETVFVANVTGVQQVGRAVLLSNNSSFCGDATFSDSTAETLPCTLSPLTNLTMSTDKFEISSGFVAFVCEGDPTRVPEGPAWIVFERLLETAWSNRSCQLDVSTPFLSNYSGFEVIWMHRATDLDNDDTDNSRSDSSSETVITPLCSNIDSENVMECLQICIDEVDNPVAMVEGVEICERVVNESLSHLPLRDENLNTVLSVLNALSNASGTQTLDSSIGILGDLVDELRRVENRPSLTTDNITMVVHVFDALLAEGRRTDWFELQKEKRRAGALLWSLEETGKAVSMALNSSGLLSTFTYEGSNILDMAVTYIQAEDYLAGVFQFPRSSQFAGGDTVSTGIEIPLELLCDSPALLRRNPNNTSGAYGGRGQCPAVITSLSVRNLPSYLDQSANSSESMAGSLLLLAQVANSAILEDQIGAQPITIHFTLVDGAENSTNETCVFWDFTLSDWSSRGLETQVDDNGNVICISTHLTSFAVLVDFSGAEAGGAEEAFALMIVTYVGCGISLLCLLMSLLIFAICGKNLNKGVLLYIHANFITALSLGLFVFIAGIETAIPVQWLCTVVAALLHYLFLCVFCWMLAEGIMLYLLVVRVFGTAAEKWYYLLPLGWGLPVLIVGVSVGIRHDAYGTENFCWLSTQFGVIWAFVGPMLLISVINSVILVLTLYHMVRGTRYRGAQGGVKNLQLVKTALKGLVILLPLLGVTWVVGLLAVNQNTTVFAWIFTILNSLQGFFIFIFHVLRNDKVWDTVKRWMRCLVPVTGMERKDTMKELSSNMPTGETSDGMDVSSPDSERVNTTQYRLQTFERTLSAMSQDSSTSLFPAPPVLN